MREERGKTIGDQIINEPLDLTGTIVGNVRIIDGGKVYLRGAVYGNLTVEEGGRVHVYGNVSGILRIEKDAKVIISGVVGGDVVNNGGRLHLDDFARVMGRLRRLDGETQIDRKAQYRE